MNLCIRSIIDNARSMSGSVYMKASGRLYVARYSSGYRGQLGEKLLKSEDESYIASVASVGRFMLENNFGYHEGYNHGIDIDFFKEHNGLKGGE